MVTNESKNCSQCGSKLEPGSTQASCPSCLSAGGLAKNEEPLSSDAEKTQAGENQVGRYRLISIIGQGGMGQVYKATDPQLGRTVAIKFLPIQLANSTESMQRFQQEASTLSRLSDPNVCIIHDIGNSHRGPYIVMEYVQGESLSDLLAREQIPISQCLDIMIQICSGLRMIHENDIVHRDIKPSNIMLTEKQVVKLVDFGLAKWISSDQSNFTKHADQYATRLKLVQTMPGQVMGTPSYMSPEQAAGTAVDFRSDVFSLGALFYRMLVGKPPFIAETPMLTMQKIITRNYPSMRSSNPEIPDSLGIIVDRMLGELDKRYPSIDEILPLLETEKSSLQIVGSGPQTNKSVSAQAMTDERPLGDVKTRRSTLPKRTTRIAFKLAPWLLVLVAIFFLRNYFPGPSDSNNGSLNETPASSPSKPSPSKPSPRSPDSISIKQEPIGHHMILGVIVDPTPFVDQKNPENKGPLDGDLHREIQENLKILLQEAEFPLVATTDQEWHRLKDTIEKETQQFNYSLSVAKLLENKNANLFLSTSGYRDIESQDFHFQIQFFNRDGAEFRRSDFQMRVGDNGQQGELAVGDLLRSWLAKSFYPKLESSGTSPSVEQELPAIDGIVVLYPFTTSRSPQPLFKPKENEVQRTALQHRLAEKLRHNTRVVTPTEKEWEQHRDENRSAMDISWKDFLSPLGCNSLLSVEGMYHPDLLTYEVKLYLNQGGTVYQSGQHRFAFTREVFREQFEEVTRQLVEAPILPSEEP